MCYFLTLKKSKIINKIKIKTEVEIFSLKCLFSHSGGSKLLTENKNRSQIFENV